MKKILIISIIVFILVAACALGIVLNKGHIGSYALVAIEEVEEEEIIQPKLLLTLEKDYLFSTNKKETLPITVSIEGEGDVLLENVELSTSDKSIVKINDDYELVAVSDGTATITAVYDGLEATQDVKVITPIKSMTFTSTSSTVKVGKDLQMKLQTSPSNAYVKGLEYTSSDEKIAVVDSSGIVTGVSAGSVTITVYDSYTELEKSVKLTIKNP